MRFLIFITTTIIQLFSTILLLRVWIEWAKVDIYNQFCKIIFKITKKIIDPIHKFVPNIFSFDITTLLFTYLLTLINIFLILLITNSLIMTNAKLLIITFIQLLTYIGKLIFWLILMRLIFNLISNRENQIYNILIQLTEPLIYQIKKIIPSIFGIDFSSFIIMIILIILKQIRLNILLFIEPNISNLLYSVGYLV